MMKKFKSIKGFAKELTAIRNRSAPQENIDKFNKIMDEEERLRKQKENAPDKGGKKIARSPETET